MSSTTVAGPVLPPALGPKLPPSSPERFLRSDFVAAGIVLVITLGFASAQRALMGLGLVGFAFYLWHFYYQLDLTFLAKSMVLAGTGVVLLGLRWVIGRVWADA